MVSTVEKVNEENREDLQVIEAQFTQMRGHRSYNLLHFLFFVI